MKTKTFLNSLIVLAIIGLTASCSKKESSGITPGIGTSTSLTTIEKDKEKIEESGIELVAHMNAFEDEAAVETVVNMAELMDESSLKKGSIPNKLESLIHVISNEGGFNDVVKDMKSKGNEAELEWEDMKATYTYDFVFIIF